MNPYIRDRIQRKLDTLSDERLYQVLDYVEFLEVKYAERAASPVSFFQRFTESVEDKMRVGGLSVGAITETVGILNKAANVLNGVAQSTMSVASDVASAAARAVDQVGAPSTAAANPNAPQSGIKPPVVPSPGSTPAGLPPDPAT
ncbi:MAG: hypothetical protein ABI120_04295 [Gemmatimonadaceae bacterium]